MMSTFKMEGNREILRKRQQEVQNLKQEIEEIFHHIPSHLRTETSETFVSDILTIFDDTDWRELNADRLNFRELCGGDHLEEYKYQPWTAVGENVDKIVEESLVAENQHRGVDSSKDWEEVQYFSDSNDQLTYGVSPFDEELVLVHCSQPECDRIVKKEVLDLHLQKVHKLNTGKMTRSSSGGGSHKRKSISEISPTPDMTSSPVPLAEKQYHYRRRSLRGLYSPQSHYSPLAAKRSKNGDMAKKPTFDLNPNVNTSVSSNPVHHNTVVNNDGMFPQNSSKGTSPQKSSQKTKGLKKTKKKTGAVRRKRVRSDVTMYESPASSPTSQSKRLSINQESQTPDLEANQSWTEVHSVHSQTLHTWSLEAKKLAQRLVPTATIGVDTAGPLHQNPATSLAGLGTQTGNVVPRSRNVPSKSISSQTKLVMDDTLSWLPPTSSLMKDIATQADLGPTRSVMDSQMMPQNRASHRENQSAVTNFDSTSSLTPDLGRPLPYYQPMQTTTQSGGLFDTQPQPNSPYGLPPGAHFFPERGHPLRVQEPDPSKTGHTEFVLEPHHQEVLKRFIDRWQGSLPLRPPGTPPRSPLEALTSLEGVEFSLDVSTQHRAALAGFMDIWMAKRKQSGSKSPDPSRTVVDGEGFKKPTQEDKNMLAKQQVAIARISKFLKQRKNVKSPAQHPLPRSRRKTRKK